LAVGMGNGQGLFNSLLPLPSSFNQVMGEVRSINRIKLAGNKNGLLMAINNDSLKLFEYH
jgi:hypothetical protein